MPGKAGTLRRASVSTLFRAPEGVQTAKGDKLSAPGFPQAPWYTQAP
jgi:hypothetical protein